MLSLVLSSHLSYGQAIGGELSKCSEDLRAIDFETPRYPMTPQQHTEMNGTVLLEFVVGISGTVSDPRVIESSHHRFRRSAQKAILRTRFPMQSKECTHQHRYDYVVE